MSPVVWFVVIAAGVAVGQIAGQVVLALLGVMAEP